ncbi:hypothetical protein HAX54_036633 [Datura stramonium]|uniref:FBD domain-containing protein n=1 Tax=Datura stramonium TaxID=4076 RepID=A0ABS8SGB4_DATST|nr:hypothetical protein [Datura stramonium]
MWEIVTPMDGEVVAVPSNLTIPDCMDNDLIALEKIKLTNFENSSAELVIMKLLLARFPSLVKVTVRPTRSLEDDEVRRFYLDLQQFPPASPNFHVLLEELPNDVY